jgi:hypothetical protein
MGRVRVDGTHSWQARIQGDQHVQALSLPHLPHNEPVRTHAQGFLHQTAEWNFALTFEVWLPALEPHDVPERKLQFKDFLDSDDALPASNARRQTIQHGRFACLRRP